MLSFIGSQPGKVGTREIARAFGLKNADRIVLKRMLRELRDEGRLESRGKKLHHAGTLPSTVLADVTARDSDGDLIATPDEWDEEAHGAAPKIRIHTARKARPGTVSLGLAATQVDIYALSAALGPLGGDVVDTTLSIDDELKLVEAISNARDGGIGSGPATD